VGVCASGKTTLVNALRARGLNGYSVAQEHSAVPYLWALGRPDFVVYLDVSYEEAGRRRRIYWGSSRLQRQREALKAARSRCDLYLDTSNLTPAEVLENVLAVLGERGVDIGPGYAGHGQEAPGG
jgi:hypothetical protein